MLASINPLGERGRHQHYPITVSAFIATSALAGTAFGALLGITGALFADARVALTTIAALALSGLALDRHAFGLRVPSPRRQVEENWLSTYRGWVYGAGFGAQLGLGFTTIVTASATWIAFACALLCGSPIGGALIGGTYGLVRALPVLMTAHIHEPSALRVLMRRLEHWRPRVASATLVAQSGVVLVALAVAAGAN
jgi:hypothetical protein